MAEREKSSQTMPRPDGPSGAHHHGPEAHDHGDHEHDDHDHSGHDHGGEGHDHAPHADHGHAGHGHGAKRAGGGHSHAGHSHGGHSHAGHSHASSSETRTAIAAIITLSFMVLEFVGGLWSGSLALMADAAHMATDAVSLGLAWWAFRQLRQPVTDRMSFGHHRMPVLVAFANAVALILLTLWIAVEAIERLMEPVHISAGPMAAIAVAGLGANIAAFLVLSMGERNLNIRGALLHVASDMLGSVAAIAAAGVIYFTGWVPIDPILSLLVGFLLLRATISLMRDSAHILLEGAPEGREGALIAADLVANVPPVVDVHHVHSWLLSEERLHATLHVVVAEGTPSTPVVTQVKERLRTEFGISHATVEVELPGACADETGDEAGPCAKPAAAAHA
ncbi:cobalt-zinc-cadmium efflux system protein [Pseudoxanthobacter soli DSM 19599]|uniref:Cobalt-zinc-cadmium efflux system protein n=1 Tax=Pseudoxanthobacter soli DSM 19599 TaxID=1123029 RepID=A0A1M7Z4X7_9HYPH|nr:cation diffusion facilitator family transporter [Pseudoxanthobacter soli]SHO59872.1 cobalt-zinc-cadmium efflux system protein [Pseudoxanthobacter soli DSM 19599]